MTPATRYLEAHILWFQRERPHGWRDGHYLPPKDGVPDYTTHSGMIDYMVNYIKWIGGNAHRQNVVVRVNDTVVKEDSGNEFTERRYIKSSRRGIADVQGTIKGLRVQFDAKMKGDRKRDDQLKEQARERKAGGIYEFISTPEQFLQIIDGLLYG